MEKKATGREGKWDSLTDGFGSIKPTGLNKINSYLPCVLVDTSNPLALFINLVLSIQMFGSCILLVWRLLQRAQEQGC